MYEVYEKPDLDVGQCDCCGYHRGKHMEGCLDGEPRPISIGLLVSVTVGILANVVVWWREIVWFLF